MRQIKEQYDEVHLQILTISVDDAQTSQSVRQADDLMFPLLSDPDIEVGEKYNVSAAPEHMHLPSVFLIDKTGKIQLARVGVAHGPFDATVYDTALKMVLEKKLS